VVGALSHHLGMEVTRAQLGEALIALSAACLKVDLTIRRRYQQAEKSD